MDRSEQDAVGRTAIKKKCFKYWLNTIDIKYSRRMLPKLISSSSEIDLKIPMRKLTIY